MHNQCPLFRAYPPPKKTDCVSLLQTRKSREGETRRTRKKAPCNRLSAAALRPPDFKKTKA